MKNQEKRTYYQKFYLNGQIKEDGGWPKSWGIVSTTAENPQKAAIKIVDNVSKIKKDIPEPYGTQISDGTLLIQPYGDAITDLNITEVRSIPRVGEIYSV